MRRFLKRLQLKISPTWKRKQSIKSKRHKTPIKDKPKEKHAKTHTNQTNKDNTQRKNIKSSKGEATSNRQGKPIHLTADLSAETLQAKREWQDIFKVLKGKNLQPRLLYLAMISFKIDGEIKSFSDKQKRIQYHQTSFTTNVKGTYTVKKYKRTRKIYKINPKQLRKWQQEHIYQ